MGTLYDDQEDPLDGTIAALQGIGQGVQAYQEGRRYQDAQQREAEQRRLQLAMLARQARYQDRALAIREEDNRIMRDRYAQAAARDRADTEGIFGVLDQEYGGVRTGQQGPLPSGEALGRDRSGISPEVTQALEGLRGMRGSMSPEAMRVAGDELRKYAQDRTFEDARGSLGKSFDAMVMPKGPDGQPLQQQGPPLSNSEMLGGYFGDDAEIQSIRADLRAAKTPQQLAAVEGKMAKIREGRVEAVRLGEDRQNWYAALDPMFSEALQRNEERVNAGGEDQYAEIDALRSRFLEDLAPDSQLTRTQLRESVNSIRSALSKIRAGVSGSKGKSFEKGSPEYYQMLRTDPEAWRDRAYEQAKTLGLVGPEVPKHVDAEMQRFEAQRAQNQQAADEARLNRGGRDALQGLPYNEGMPTGGFAAPGEQGAIDQSTPAPETPHGLGSADPTERVRGAMQLVNSLAATKPVSKEVAFAALKAARDGQNVEEAMRRAWNEIGRREGARAKKLEHVGPSF